MELKNIAEKVRLINDLNGWTFPTDNVWEKEEHKHFIPTKLMLCVSELSEALEAFRNRNYDNFKEEIADTIIRLLDISTGMNFDIEQEILKKLSINSKRGFRHGNKKV